MKLSIPVAAFSLLIALMGAPEVTAENRGKSSQQWNLWSNQQAAPRQQHRQGLAHKMDLILDKLNKLERQLDCDMQAFLDGDCDDNPASAAASFCISQSRAVELGLEYAIEAPTEWEGGLGWAEVGDVKATISPVHPTILVSPIVAPIPIAVLPNSVSVGAGGDLGQGMDVCVEIPIVLNREDTETLARLSRDLHTPRLSFAESKFQRRAGRVLSFADRRIPNDLSGDEEEARFDRADAAVSSLLDEGWSFPEVGSGGFRAFKDANVTALLATLDVPVTARTLLETPEEIFGALPDSITDLSCASFGVDQTLRNERANLDRLCTELESLPDFERVRDGLEQLADFPSDVVEAVADLLEPLLQDIPNAEDAADAKRRVCSRPIAQRRGLSRLCD